MIGRGSSVTTVLGRHALKRRCEAPERFDNERDRLAAAIRDMDRITNAKMIREAKVYRPVLVDYESSR